MNENRTELSQLGEFGLIDQIRQDSATRGITTVTGIGDDAAVIATNGNEVMVVTKDLLLEGIHFDLTYVPLKHLGYKAVAVNVSDVAAMNVAPTQVLTGIGLSNRFSVEAVKELYAGIHAACNDYNIDLVGGDTVSSASGLTLSVTAIGRGEKSRVCRRTQARTNDIICVTGDLGAAYLGLQVLEREKEVFLANPEMQPGLEKYEYIVGRQLKPSARTDIIYDLAELEVQPTAMIDISDGLASELLHLSSGSNVGFKIFDDKIPIDQQSMETALEFKLDPITCALHGGEDYELLFTIRQEDFEKIKNHPDIHTIGHAHTDASTNVLVTKGGSTVPLTAQGWKQFRADAPDNTPKS